MINVEIKDIMCTTPVKVCESVSIKDVNHLLLRYRINGILIVADNDKTKLVGIFTTTDSLRLLDKVLSKGGKKMEFLAKMGEKPVGRYASKDIITLDKNMKITKAIAIMHNKNVHTLPVYDGDQLVGIIGRHDLINMSFA